MTNPLAIGRPKRPLMALSTDGDRLAFVAASAGQPPRLHIHDFARNTTDVLPGTDHAMSPVFSPDGRFLAFWTPSPAGALMKVPADGSGRPVLLCASAQPFGAAWTADGSIIFAEEWGPLLTVSASGGTPRAITQVAAGSDESHRLPHLLPDGRGVLFTVLGYSPFSIADWQNARVEALVPGRPERKVVLQGVTDARYLRTGHLLYGRRGVMEAVSFDLDRLEVTGGASVVLPDVMQAMNTGNTLTETGAVQVAVSPSGNLAYLAGGVPPLPDVADFIWIDRAGRLTPVGVPAGPYVGGSLSPGGKRLALRGYGAKPGLWVWDFERGVFQNLTTNSSHRWPLWTPDGGGLVYGSCERGRWELFLKEIEGHAPARTLASGFAPAAWGDEGRTLIFTSVTKPTAASGLMEQSDIWTLSMSGEQAAARAWLDSPANEDNPALSPDGHWLAYTSVSPSEDRSGAIPHIYVEAFPGHSSPRQVTDAAGGIAPVWSPDGKELFYVADCRNKPLAYCLCVCDVRLGGSVSFGRPREILELPGFVNTGPLRSWDTADGRTFIYLRERAVDVPATPPIKEMHVVLNWFDELKAKVPSK